MQYPLVSIIIVNYNVKDFLIQCIDSIHQSDSCRKTEIIVVDNHSFDGSQKILKKRFPHIKLIENQENIGFGSAVNQGAELASGEYLFVLNPDTIIQEDTINVLVNYLIAHKEVGMVGPKIINSDGKLQQACKRSFPTFKVALPKLLGISKLFPNSTWAGKYNLTYLDPDKIHSVDAVSGACMLMKTNLFRKLDGFDEEYFMYGEDIDLCYRLKQRGNEIHYNPETQILHYQGESVKFAPFDSINAFYNAMSIFYKNHFSRTQSIFSRLGIYCGIKIYKLFSFLKEFKSQIYSITFDIIAIITAFLITIPLRFSNFDPIFLSYGIIPTIYIIFWLIVGGYFQLYGRYILSYSRAFFSTLIGFFIVVAFTFFFNQFAYSRLIILLSTAIVAVLIPGWRIAAHFLMTHGVLRRIKEKHNILFTRKTLIFGANQSGIRIAKLIQNRVDSGLDIIGFSDTKLSLSQSKLPVPYLGSLEDIRDIINFYNVREVIFSNKCLSYRKIVSLMDETKDLNITYRMVPREADILIGKASIEEIGDLTFIQIEYSLFHRIHKLTKRIFDLGLSILLSGIFLPIFIGKSLLHRPVRISFWGEGNREINALYFESKSRFIERIPLLWSIIKGDMSFVGSSLIPFTKPNPNLVCTPGLTGLGRIQNGQLTNKEYNQFDHYYVQNHNLLLDIEILLKSAFVGK